MTGCTGTTRAGRPCKNEAARWPDGVDGDPLLCGKHTPEPLREVRDAGFAEEARREAARFDAMVPACWSWDPELSLDRVCEEYAGPGDAAGAEAFMRRFRDGDRRALRFALACWHQGRCAACGFRDWRLVDDHDHDTGLIRGLLCRGCNTAEGFADDGNGQFRRYRERPPAQILGIRLVYVDPIYGPAQPRDRSARQLDDHPSFVLASILEASLRPKTEGEE